MKIMRHKFITLRSGESDVVSKPLMNLPFLYHLSYTRLYLLFSHFRYNLEIPFNTTGMKEGSCAPDSRVRKNMFCSRALKWILVGVTFLVFMVIIMHLYCEIL